MFDLQSIFNEIKPLLKKYQPPFAPKTDTETHYDLWSFKDIVINGRKRKEVYFAAIIVQKSYVGFYFMPVYVESDMNTVFHPELMKLLKGKSCFHVKRLTPELVAQIESALQIGFDLYRQRGWV